MGDDTEIATSVARAIAIAPDDRAAAHSYSQSSALLSSPLMAGSLHTTTDGTAAVSEQEHEETCCYDTVQPTDAYIPIEIQQIDQTELVIDPKILVENDGGTEMNTKTKDKKKSKRRGGKYRKNNNRGDDALNGYEKKGFVQRYSREEMEAMRFEGLEDQKKKWVEVYCGLCPIVAQEYDGLLNTTEKINHNQKKHDDITVPSFDFDPRPQFMKSPHLGEDRFQFADSRSENLNTLDDEEIGCSIVEEDYSQDDDTDEDYSSIQRPAFVVKGEPDFDSGPPQDGLEYLRRVRWEAARVPKVKVAKVNKMKEQSLYMPQIPGIMKCPDNLLPLKQWEDSFLADFAELRLVFSQLDPQNPNNKAPIKVQSIHKEDIMLESTVFEKFSNTSNNDSNDAKVNKHIDESSSSLNDLPTLATILNMEVAARNSMLKKRIRSIENMNMLTRNDCLWLFALCVAVDCPLDADTSAALRSLLRKCASLRAVRTEVDEPVIALNMLVTISGRYFGQLEN